jgi:hypothetical protein
MGVSAAVEHSTPPVDVALVARVQARLSAALTPISSEEDAERVLRLGAKAIAATNELDDPETRGFVLHNARSGAVFMMRERERFAITRELVTLAESQGQYMTLMRFGADYATQLRDRGQRADSDAYLTTLAKVFAAHDRPSVRWRLPMLRSAVALFDGDLDAAARYSDEGLAIGESAGVGHAFMIWAIQRIAMAIASGRPERVLPDAERLLAALDPRASAFTAWRAWLLALMGRLDEAKQLTSQFLVPWVAMLASASEYCKLVHDRELARQLYQRISAVLQIDPVYLKEWRFFFGGFAIGVVFGPMARVLGDLALVSGDTATARRHYEESVDVCRSVGAPLFLALSTAALERI